MESQRGIRFHNGFLHWRQAGDEVSEKAAGQRSLQNAYTSRLAAPFSTLLLHC